MTSTKKIGFFKPSLTFIAKFLFKNISFSWVCQADPLNNIKATRWCHEPQDMQFMSHTLNILSVCCYIASEETKSHSNVNIRSPLRQHDIFSARKIKIFFYSLNWTSFMNDIHVYFLIRASSILKFDWDEIFYKVSNDLMDFIYESGLQCL